MVAHKKVSPTFFCPYIVNNTIFTFEETTIFCIYSYNHVVYVLLSNIKYSMTRMHKLGWVNIVYTVVQKKRANFGGL